MNTGAWVEVQGVNKGVDVASLIAIDVCECVEGIARWRKAPTTISTRFECA